SCDESAPPQVSCSSDQNKSLSVNVETPQNPPTIALSAVKPSVSKQDDDNDVGGLPYSNRPSLYIGPPETSYSCDSIDEFTPNIDEQELYVSSFSESEDENDAAGDVYDDASESEPSRYYSALGQHECELDYRGRAHHHHTKFMRRSLSYTFANDPDRYNACNADEDDSSAVAFASWRLMARSAEELLTNQSGHCGEHTNCGDCSLSRIRHCALRREQFAKLNTNTRQSRSLSPPAYRLLSNTTAGVAHTDVLVQPSTLQVPSSGNGAIVRSFELSDRMVRLVRYPLRAMTRFASDPSLPLGHAWYGHQIVGTAAPDMAGANLRAPPGVITVSATDPKVYVSLTTPPPDDDDNAPLLRLLGNDGDEEATLLGGATDMQPRLVRKHLPYRGWSGNVDNDDERCLAADNTSSVLTYYDATATVPVQPTSTDEPDGSSFSSGIPISSQSPILSVRLTPEPPVSSDIVTQLSSSADDTQLITENVITNPGVYSVPICSTTCPTSTTDTTTITTTISTSAQFTSTTTTATITNPTVTTTTSFFATVASSSSVTTTTNTTDTTVCSAVVVPCVPSVADTSNFFSTRPSYTHTTNTTNVLGSPTMPSLVCVASNRKKSHCSAKLLVKSYTIDGGSAGTSYSAMMMMTPNATLTTTTATSTVFGAEEAATAAAGTAGESLGATHTTFASTAITATSSTATAGSAGSGSCLYCCSGVGGSGTVAKTPAGAGATAHCGSGSPSSCCCCCCCCYCYSTPSSSSAGGLAGTGVGGPAGTATATTVRRQRHSIAGQMSYFKMLGTFSKKMATSTNSLFSTAVISGSSSAPNLRDMIPSTASPSGFGGVPPIRPLETLHNALSLKQLDAFLERMTVAPLFKTPASSPPPKHPLIGTAALADSTAAPAGGSRCGAGTLPTLSLAGTEAESISASSQTVGGTAAAAAAQDDKCQASQRSTGGRDFVPLAAVGQQAAVGGAAGPGTGGAVTANGGASSIAGAQQSWSDHSSSMTSSISALSSGGPSSPNYSEVYSRGCPSSDMSASITSSTDGSSLAAIVGGTEQQLVTLPHLFSHTQPQVSPKHPQTDLATVAVTTCAELGPQEDPTNPAVSCGVDPCLRRSSTLDISGDLTPVSACSDWDSNTNEATKGSTANYDLTTATTNTMEEDDEDATISTDTCLSVGDQQQQHQQQHSTVEPTPTASSSSSGVGKLPLFRGAFPFDEPHQTDDLGNATGTKVDNRIRGSRIQRQISLYEKDTRTEPKNLHQGAHEWCAEGLKFEPAGHRSRVGPQQQLPRLHMSFDELRKELPYNERNLLSQQDPGAQQVRDGGVGAHQELADKCFLKSLAQLTVSQRPPAPESTSGATGPPSPHTPGALVIREGFIEPPRLTRVTKSFHGKTNHQKLNIEQQQQQLESSRSVGDPGSFRRASDSPIAAPTRYNKNAIRSQQQQAGGSRFTTSIVQEPPPEQRQEQGASGGSTTEEPSMPSGSK
uniref:Uncharacterized protein n=1 Tax=Anopheles dirus TaxID=7168 RepID=A0A182NVE5_9DIPT